MPVYKDGKKWRIIYRYKDHRGITQQTQKRGFKTQREAKEWEDKIKRKLNSDLNMTFGSFVELYTADRQSRVKENTWRTKEHIMTVEEYKRSQDAKQMTELLRQSHKIEPTSVAEKLKLQLA